MSGLSKRIFKKKISVSVTDMWIIELLNTISFFSTMGMSLTYFFNDPFLSDKIITYIEISLLISLLSFFGIILC